MSGLASRGAQTKARSLVPVAEGEERWHRRRWSAAGADMGGALQMHVVTTRNTQLWAK